MCYVLPVFVCMKNEEKERERKKTGRENENERTRESSYWLISCTK